MKVVYAAVVLFLLVAAAAIYAHQQDPLGVIAKTDACLSRVAPGAGNESCFNDQIDASLKAGGLSSAFDTFRTLYAAEPLFRGLACHDAGHILGAAAYTQYTARGIAFTAPEVSYCGYGFYHGFLETMLITDGPGNYTQVRNYCSSLSSNEGAQISYAEGSCDHGIGHALFDLLPVSLYGNAPAMVASALSSCQDALPASTTTPQQVQCSTGVFNSLAIALSAKNYNLAFAGTSTLALCAAQIAPYQPGCFSEVGIGVIRDMNLDRTEVLSLIASISNEQNANALLTGYATDEVDRAAATGDISAAYGLCDAVPAVQQQACAQGIVDGIRQGAAAPGQEYIAGFAYCKNDTPAAEQNDCYHFAIAQLGAAASNKAAFLQACLALPQEVSQWCPLTHG